MKLYPAPANLVEDENYIGENYMVWLGPVLFLAPILGILFLEMKIVAAISIGVALFMLHEMRGRLHDLVMRHRRTNLLLRELKEQGQGRQ